MFGRDNSCFWIIIIAVLLIFCRKEEDGCQCHRPYHGYARDCC